MTSIGGLSAQQARPLQSLRSSSGPFGFEAGTARIDGKEQKVFSLNTANGTPASELSPQDASLFKVRQPEPDLASSAIMETAETSAFVKTQMSTYATVRTANGEVEISNAGYVGSTFDIGGRWYQEGLDGLSGPARASEIANRLAARFGGEVKIAPTAVSQNSYKALENVSTTTGSSTYIYGTATRLRETASTKSQVQSALLA